jgi:DNA replication protein DnaC
MSAKPLKSESKKDSPKCTFCEYNGIVYNPFYIKGENPLIPCEKCVTPHCKCNGVEPYYYHEDNQIKDCPCRSARLRIIKIESIYRNSGIDKYFRWKFFGDYDAKRNKMSNEAKNYAYDLVMNFPKVNKGLYLWGTTGTGKTLLSIIILTELITRYGVDGKFIKVSRNYLNKLKDTFNISSDNFGQTSQIERELAEVNVLVIDDFGVQRDSTWEQETLYNLIDARYEAQKFTLFTSNINSYDALDKLSSGRVLSRIKEMCEIMELSGNDYRAEI